MSRAVIETTDQVQLWNGAAGEAWLGMQPVLDRLFEPFETLLVGAARWHQPRRVLDIGCGTGATTLAVARALDGNGRCTGADLSRMMIERARERAAAEPGTNADFIAG